MALRDTVRFENSSFSGLGRDLHRAIMESVDDRLRRVVDVSPAQMTRGCDGQPVFAHLDNVTCQCCSAIQAGGAVPSGQVVLVNRRHGVSTHLTSNVSRPMAGGATMPISVGVISMTNPATRYAAIQQKKVQFWDVGTLNDDAVNYTYRRWDSGGKQIASWDTAVSGAVPADLVAVSANWSVSAVTISRAAPAGSWTIGDNTPPTFSGRFVQAPAKVTQGAGAVDDPEHDLYLSDAIILTTAERDVSLYYYDSSTGGDLTVRTVADPTTVIWSMRWPFYYHLSNSAYNWKLFAMTDGSFWIGWYQNQLPPDPVPTGNWRPDTLMWRARWRTDLGVMLFDQPIRLLDVTGRPFGSLDSDQIAFSGNTMPVAYVWVSTT